MQIPPMISPLNMTLYIRSEKSGPVHYPPSFRRCTCRSYTLHIYSVGNCQKNHRKPGSLHPLKELNPGMLPVGIGLVCEYQPSFFLSLIVFKTCNCSSLLFNFRYQKLTDFFGFRFCHPSFFRCPGCQSAFYENSYEYND